MKSKNNTNQTFWQWLFKYRAKIGLLTFLIAIPLSLILITYLGPYISNKSVHFDEEKTDVQRSFQAIDELEELEIVIDWTRLYHTKYDEDGVISTNGSYTFSMNYETKGAYDISSVSITPVLHTDWFPYYSVGTTTSLYTSKKSVTLIWNEEFPMHKLLFVTVNEPNLYLKVEYAYVTLDQTINKTAYVMYSLDGINPETVQ